MTQQLRKGARVIGEERARVARDVRARYDEGTSVRELSEQIGRSYGFVHRLLVESGAQLRARGGDHRTSKAVL